MTPTNDQIREVIGGDIPEQTIERLRALCGLSSTPSSAVLLAVHQIDEDRWQSMVAVDHQTIGFGPRCETEEESQWWCSQFKAALSRAGARFISPNTTIEARREADASDECSAAANNPNTTTP